MVKALVVDDNAELLSEDALALLSNDRDFDVMVTDVVMPGASGLDLAHRAQRLLPEIKIVLMSGFLPNLQIPAPWSFVPKPFTLRALLSALRK